MAFTDKLDAMGQAKADTDVQFVESLAPARDAYVQARQEQIEAERPWLDNLADDELRAVAQESWKALLAARKVLLDAVTTAAATREQSLTDAWAQIKAT